MSLQLRDYQNRGIDELRQGIAGGHLRQILVMPTGSGKTETVCGIVQLAKEKGRRVWFIVDRKTLSHQTRARFESYGLSVSVLQGDNTSMHAGDDVVVATVQTMRSRMERDGDINFSMFDAGLVVIDECHNLHKFHRDLLSAREVPCIGLTATPHNPNLGNYFSRVVAPVSVQALIQAGHLVPFRVFAPTEIELDGVRVRAGEFVESDLQDKMTPLCGDVVSHWIRLGERRPTIAFCVNVRHARELAQQFQHHGIPASVVVGGTPDEDREEAYQALRDGRIRVLCSVMVLGVGFDLPEASCAILARPTASEALHIQQCGRVARPAADKADALILDHAGNTIRHGLPQHYEPPELDQVDTRTRTERNPQEKHAIRCGNCGYVMEPGQGICPACGIEKRQTSDVVTAPGTLVEVGDDHEDSPEERRQRFQEFIGYFTTRKYNKPRGAAAYCYEHHYGSAPWKDSAIGNRYNSLEAEPPGLDAVRQAENFRKHSHAKRRGQERKKLRSFTATLPAYSGNASADSRDCDHKHIGIYQGKPPHAAQRRCKACGSFRGWVSQSEVMEIAAHD